MITIALLDYGIGNIKSISSALEKVGCNVLLTNNKKEIVSANGLIIPGVGAFKHGMDKLEKLDLISFIQDYSITERPILGICLGMQMLFSRSSEFGVSNGLNLIEGSVDKISNAGQKLKLPHVSWNCLIENRIAWKNTILDSIGKENFMYFVHSFVASPVDKNNILSMTQYEGIEFCSTVKKNNIYGCQFHPEKSADQGLQILKSFSYICEEIL